LDVDEHRLSRQNNCEGADTAARPLFVALLGLALLRRAPRTGRFLAWTGCLTLLFFSLPPVAYFLARPLEDVPPLDLSKGRGGQAIVILGGGVRRNAFEYGGDTLARLTLERTRYGARVAKETGLPVLVSGGASFGAVAEADLMYAALTEEFGISVEWVENRSRDTHENALYSARMLRAAGIKRVILVTHGMDIRRARAEFEASGLEVIPAPTAISTIAFVSPLDFLPSMGALQMSHHAAYEWIAILWRALTTMSDQRQRHNPPRSSDYRAAL
jgi:uncharacterized SAM-binding protein YcdF (DUF218 family)